MKTIGFVILKLWVFSIPPLQSNIILKNIRIKEDSFDDDILSDNEYFIKYQINNSNSVSNTQYDISKFNPLNII